MPGLLGEVRNIDRLDEETRMSDIQSRLSGTSRAGADKFRALVNPQSADSTGM